MKKLLTISMAIISLTCGNVAPVLGESQPCGRVVYAAWYSENDGYKGYFSLANYDLSTFTPKYLIKADGTIDHDTMAFRAYALDSKGRDGTAWVDQILLGMKQAYFACYTPYTLPNDYPVATLRGKQTALISSVLPYLGANGGSPADLPLIRAACVAGIYENNSTKPNSTLVEPNRTLADPVFDSASFNQTDKNTTLIATDAGKKIRYSLTLKGDFNQVGRKLAQLVIDSQSDPKFRVRAYINWTFTREEAITVPGSPVTKAVYGEVSAFGLYPAVVNYADCPGSPYADITKKNPFCFNCPAEYVPVYAAVPKATPTPGAPTPTPTPIVNSGPVNPESNSPIRDIGRPLSRTGQFLWKPSSDRDEKLVVLLPARLNGKISRVVVVSPDQIDVLARGRSTGTSRDGRPVYRFSRPGASFPDGSFVVVSLKDGSRRHLAIANTSRRTTR